MYRPLGDYSRIKFQKSDINIIGLVTFKLYNDNRLAHDCNKIDYGFPITVHHVYLKFSRLVGNKSIRLIKQTITFSDFYIVTYHFISVNR